MSKLSAGGGGSSESESSSSDSSSIERQKRKAVERDQSRSGDASSSTSSESSGGGSSSGGGYASRVAGGVRRLADAARGGSGSSGSPPDGSKSENTASDAQNGGKTKNRDSNNTQSNGSEGSSKISPQRREALRGLGVSTSADGSLHGPTAPDKPTKAQQDARRQQRDSLHHLGVQFDGDGNVTGLPKSGTTKVKKDAQAAQDRALRGLGISTDASGQMHAPNSGSHITYRQEQERKKLRSAFEEKLKKKYGVDVNLSPGDLNYSTKSKNGKTVLTGSLSSAGREDLKVAQTPFKDVPGVGDVLTAGSRFDAQYSNFRRKNRKELNKKLDSIPGVKQAQDARKRIYQQTDQATKNALNGGLDFLKGSGKLGSQVAGAGLILGTVGEDVATGGAGVLDDPVTLGAGTALLLGGATVGEELNKHPRMKTAAVNAAADTVAKKASFGYEPTQSSELPTVSDSFHPNDIGVPSNPSQPALPDTIPVPNPSEVLGGPFGVPEEGISIPTTNGGPTSNEISVPNGGEVLPGGTDVPTGQESNPTLLDAQQLVGMNKDQLGKGGRGSRKKNKDLPDNLIPDRNVVIGENGNGGGSSGLNIGEKNNGVRNVGRGFREEKTLPNPNDQFFELNKNSLNDVGNLFNAGWLSESEPSSSAPGSRSTPSGGGVGEIRDKTTGQTINPGQWARSFEDSLSTPASDVLSSPFQDTGSVTNTANLNDVSQRLSDASRTVSETATNSPASDFQTPQSFSDSFEYASFLGSDSQSKRNFDFPSTGSNVPSGPGLGEFEKAWENPVANAKEATKRLFGGGQ